MGKKLVLWALGVFLGLAALGGVLDALGLDGESNRSGDEEEDVTGDEPPRSASAARRSEEKGKGSGETARSAGRVTRVIDGDTVIVAGLGRVRLIGVDTPEQGRCYEPAATRFTQRRIGGRVVRYEVGVEPRDRYGRTLVYLYREGTMHNLELLSEGYARVLTIAPNDKYVSRFKRAAAAARAVDRGVWGNCDRPFRAQPRRRTSPPPAAPPGRPRGGGSLAPPPPDLDCSEVGHPVQVGPGDPHRLDRDGDGIGCD